MYKAKYHEGELEHGKFLVPRLRTDTFKAKKKGCVPKVRNETPDESLDTKLDMNKTRINLIALRGKINPLKQPNI